MSPLTLLSWAVRKPGELATFLLTLGVTAWGLLTLTAGA